MRFREGSDQWSVRAKLEALKPSRSGLHPSSVPDVGSGLLCELLQHDSIRDAVCVDRGYERNRDKAAAGTPRRFRRVVEHFTADLVSIMHSVEHVAEDVVPIRGYGSRGRVGTGLRLTVPAC